MMKFSRTKNRYIVDFCLIFPAVGLLFVGLAFHEDIPSRVAAKLFPSPFPEKAGKIELPSRLTSFAKKLQENNSVIIVAFGDSITQGATSRGTRNPELVYHNQLKRLLENRYPDVTFSVINSGIGGDEASDGLARIDESVIRFSPDLVLIEFGLNDSVRNGLAGVRKFKLTIAEIVRKIKQQTEAEIVLLTPNFLATSDNQNIHEEHRRTGWTEAFSKIQNSRALERYAQAIQDVAMKYHIPVADIYSKWELISDAIDTNSLLANGLNHPDVRGHCIIAETVMSLIDPEYTCDRQRILAIAKEQ